METWEKEWEKELELRRRLEQATRLEEKQTILEELANLPIGEDVADFVATENVQRTLESKEAQWRKELAANKRLSQRAREIEPSHRMQALKEELIADRPGRYLDATEIALRYHRFPREQLTPIQRKAVEVVYGSEDSSWNSW